MMTFRPRFLKRRIGGAGTTPPLAAHVRSVHKPPVLADIPTPRRCGYASEAVVKESFKAMVGLGKLGIPVTNKCDLWIISKAFRINRPPLAQAIPAITAWWARRLRTKFRMACRRRSRTKIWSAPQWESFERDLGNDSNLLDCTTGVLVAWRMPDGTAAHEKTRQVGAER